MAYEAGFVEVLPGALIIEPQARTWCLLQYPGHTRGCPNYGHKNTCPPYAPQAAEWLKGTSTLWLTYTKFNIMEQCQRMLAQRPGWTPRQARCLLYWQPKVNKALQEFTDDFMAAAMQHGAKAVKVSYCPEAMGIHVLQTASHCGLRIERHPVHYVHKIALVARMV